MWPIFSRLHVFFFRCQFSTVVQYETSVTVSNNYIFPLILSCLLVGLIILTEPVSRMHFCSYSQVEVKLHQREEEEKLN